MKAERNAIIIVIVCVVIGIGALVADRILGKNYLIKISYDEMVEKVENKDTFVMVISKNDCSHCKEYLPIISRVANDYKLKIYYISTDEFSEEEHAEFNSDYFAFDGTPTTVFVINGEEKTVANRITGTASRNKIVNKLKSNGFIK